MRLMTPLYPGCRETLLESISYVNISPKYFFDFFHFIHIMMAFYLIIC